MDDSKPNRRIGRPPKAPSEGRVSLGLRVTPETKIRLDGAATKSGRSQSQEAEMRLERTFVEDESDGGAEIRQIIRLAGAAFTIGGQKCAHDKKISTSSNEWLHDPDCFAAAAKHLGDALALAQRSNAPHRKIKVKIDLDPQTRKKRGQQSMTTKGVKVRGSQ